MLWLCTKIYKKLFNFYKQLNILFSKQYIRIEGKGEGSIYVSYLIEPLKNINNENYFKYHQNRQETIIIANILKKYFKHIIVESHNHNSNIINKKFDVIFGIEPNFEKACENNPNAIKIYYATGSFLEHQNGMIIKRTKEFNFKHNTNYPPLRLVKTHSSPEISNQILQIGSKYTIETYPISLRDKIKTINQTSHCFIDINIQEKIKKTSKKDYIWFGSGGNILKGLDLLLDYFIIHTEYNLHVVGPIEEKFKLIYKNQINKAQNIFIHGFMDIDSKEFREIANKCTFLIFPSASEGCPGSVINLQKLGVIPIVSRWASCDEINDLGFQLKKLNISAINEAIIWSQSLEKEKLIQLMKNNQKYCMETHSKQRFSIEFEKYFSTVRP